VKRSGVERGNIGVFLYVLVWAIRGYLRARSEFAAICAGTFVPVLNAHGDDAHGDDAHGDDAHGDDAHGDYAHGDRLCAWGQVFYREPWDAHGDRFSIENRGAIALSETAHGDECAWGQVCYREPWGNRPFVTHPVRSSGSVARRLTLSSDLSAPGTNRSTRISHMRMGTGFLSRTVGQSPFPECAWGHMQTVSKTSIKKRGRPSSIEPPLYSRGPPGRKSSSTNAHGDTCKRCRKLPSKNEVDLPQSSHRFTPGDLPVEKVPQPADILQAPHREALEHAHGDSMRMGTGLLSRTVGQSPFRHSSDSLLRVSCRSVNPFVRAQCPSNESIRSHSTCRDALSPGVTTRFPGPANMGGTLAKTLNTLYLPRFTRAAYSAPVARPSRHSSDHVRRRALPIRLHAWGVPRSCALVRIARGSAERHSRQRPRCQRLRRR
jgi:hypothetical protein